MFELIFPRILLILSLMSCNVAGQKSRPKFLNVSNSNSTLNFGQIQSKTRKLTLVHVFERGKNGVPIGKMYVRWIGEKIFDYLIITRNHQSKSDTLYIIDGKKFLIKGKIKDDIGEMAPDFVGYQFQFMGDDRFGIVYIHGKMHHSSDSLWIQWHSSNDSFAIDDYNMP